MKCLVCQGKHRTPIFYINTPYLDRKEKYTIFICSSCGQGSTDGNVDSKYLSQIYAHSFFSSSQQKVDHEDTPINHNAKNRAKALSDIKNGSLLDIGAGNGAFLSAAKIHFDVEGVEFSKIAASNARKKGFKIYEGDFLTTKIGDKKYDVITLWDVLSSLKNPEAALKKCHLLLKDDGRIILTIPMIDSWTAKLFRSCWPLLIPPVNLHYFTEKSILKLIKRTGFNFISCEYKAKWVSVQFLTIKAARSFGFAFLEPIFTKLIPQWKIPLNMYDIATVTFDKKNRLK